MGRISKFHKGEIWLMRKLVKEGVSQTIVAKMFKSTQQTISYYVKGLRNSPCIIKQGDETVEELKKRFWDKVNIKDKNECWEWQGSKTQGYGRFYVGGQSQLAHRISYYFATGDLPKPPYGVLHRCNNTQCVNPNHLYKGTGSDNMADLMKTGYRPSGKPRKLTDEQIDEVVKLNIERISQRSIAKTMHVCQWTIWNTLNNMKWA